MNKNDLIAAVAESTGLSKADATKAVDAVLDLIGGTLKSGNEVQIGKFRLTYYLSPGRPAGQV